MRITNDDYDPPELLQELMSPATVTQAQTASFFKDDAKSHDWVMRALQEKIEIVFEAYKRSGLDIHATQHIRDKGVDLLLVYASDPSTGTERRIGLQVKSELEAMRDQSPDRKEGMVATLKRQAFEAAGANLNEWWMVLAFDAEKHSKLVSTISAEMLLDKRQGMQVKLFRPQSVYALLSRTDQGTNDICSLLLCEEDLVLKEAKRELAGLHVSGIEIVLASIGPALAYGKGIDDIFSLLDSKAYQAGLVAAVNQLEDLGYLSAVDGKSYGVEASVFPALCALYYDAQVRQQYGPSEAARFIRRVTGDVKDLLRQRDL